MSTLTRTISSKPKQSVFDWIAHHWFGIFLAVYGAWVFTPWLAPVFMKLGWSDAGRTVYFIYSFFCHQLPERSFFFFGEKTMYSLREIGTAWQNSDNPFVLRGFIGNSTMGWKVAWSDRMVSFYTSVWFFAVLWWPFRKKIKPISWWVFALLLLPIAVDGITHAISDFAGIGFGFRDTNRWLAVLTNFSMSMEFYVGDALGSFNSWARLITGLLAGFGITWLAFPYIYQSQNLNQKLDQYNYGAVLEQIKNQNPRSSG
jgi:uncharacterized membrane protein